GLVLHGDDRRGQRLGVLPIGTQDPEGQAAGRLLADAGQARQLLDQPAHRRGERHHGIPGSLMPRPPVSLPISSAVIFCAARMPSFTAATTRSCSISRSRPSSSDGSMRTWTTSSLPFTVAVTIPPPALASTVRPASSCCTLVSFSWSCCACRKRPLRSKGLSMTPH